MASNINPYNIDGTFPVAGQDNPSQGFRDNFTNIKNNFLYAQSEISDIQGKAILSGALTGQTLNNDMAGTVIRRPQLASWTQTLVDQGSLSGSITLDFNVANFQKISTTGPVSINFVNWPTSVGAGALGYGVMRIWLNIQNVSHTVTLPNSIIDTVNDIAGYNSTTQTITFDQSYNSLVPGSGQYLFDISSIDGGNTYQIFDVSRNRASLRDPNIYFNPGVTATPTLFVGYGQNGGGQTSLNVAMAGDTGQNIISGFGSYNSAAVGNLGLATLTNATLDTGKIGGYTITAARGNLVTGTVTPVQSGDYLGYRNAVAYTGSQGTGNVFQQLSSIVHYATGANVRYGLGGNIAFFTADDGGNPQNVVLQAMGIENNQTVKMFGNVVTSGAVTDQGYQYLGSPSTGFTQTVQSGKSRLIIDPAVTLATGTVTLPTGNVTAGGSGDGTIITISSTAQITALTVNTVSGSVKPSGSFQLNAGTGAQFFWHDSEATWYKIG